MLISRGYQDDADERFQRNVNQVKSLTLIRIDQICSTCVGGITGVLYEQTFVTLIWN